MKSLEANIRDNSTKGQLNTIRNNGNVPAIIYGGQDQNQKISISKKFLKALIEKENFLLLSFLFFLLHHHSKLHELYKHKLL